MPYKEELQAEYDKYTLAKNIVESEVFQEFFAQRFEKERDSLKYAYQCESLKELNTLKGKQQGLNLFFEICKEIDAKLRDLRSELG